MNKNESMKIGKFSCNVEAVAAMTETKFIELHPKLPNAKGVYAQVVKESKKKNAKVG